jgi:hypothetical protein
VTMANALAYYGTEIITAVRRFTVLRPVACIISILLMMNLVLPVSDAPNCGITFVIVIDDTS